MNPVRCDTFVETLELWLRVNYTKSNVNMRDVLKLIKAAKWVEAMISSDEEEFLNAFVRSTNQAENYIHAVVVEAEKIQHTSASVGLKAAFKVVLDAAKAVEAAM